MYRDEDVGAAAAVDLSYYIAQFAADFTARLLATDRWCVKRLFGVIGLHYARYYSFNSMYRVDYTKANDRMI